MGSPLLDAAGHRRSPRGHGLRIVKKLAVRWEAANGCVTAWLAGSS